jgi:hypothetical protein
MGKQLTTEKKIVFRILFSNGGNAFTDTLTFSQGGVWMAHDGKKMFYPYCKITEIEELA